ncbi:kinesin-like protein KIF18A isoform X2 [Lutzomyia longipalpis]|uniref:kinesin-like protein KIF18A isoform X2 n=1 Tax=Lutzomyia longipalpis TaxID=7200 RepID=UPI002483AAC8|nr:kinesin-like protein KIF18A isoform X2 [Lutzomyia longipalpis]
MAKKEGKMKVAVRIRPFNRQEMEANQRIIVRVIDEQNLLFDPDDDEDEFFFHGSKMKHRDITKRVRKKLPMEYDHVFGAEATNDDIYERCMKPLISSVMDGYNCSVFVYGATGAGKTFTMLGKENVPGITYLTIQELFRQMEELSDERKFDIGVSYLEVYNEQVMNLLTKVGPLKLREDSSGVVVSGLSLKPIFSSKELIGLLAQGNLNRTQHPTDANAESSRSHAIFQVHIRMGDRKTGQKRTVKLSMIDLAGSERASSTKGIGVRFKEGASINKSLLALGNCINKLADGIAHIPYRDSNLTRILKDSLGGNCQTVMIANVSPSSLMYDDTYNTLKYASRAKKIRIACKQNVLRANLPAEFYAKKTVAQEEEIEALKKLVKQLEERNAIQVAEIKRLEAENGANQENIQPRELSREAPAQPDLKETYRRIDRIYEEIRSAMTTLIQINSKQNILILKTKFKKCIEEQKKLLYLDGTQMNSDISRLEASIDKYSRQVDDQKKMMDEWQGKYQALVMELDALRQDIQGTAGQEMVEMYMKAKERERTIMYQDQRHLHINKMMTLIKNDMESGKAAQLMGCELVQQMYLLMRANNVAMDVNLKRKLQKLAKLIEGKASIKFADDDQEDSFEALSKIRVLDFDVAVVGVGGGKRMLEDDSMGMPAKRKRLLMDEAAASTSLPPVPLFAPPNPNETHVMSGVAPLEDAPAAQEMNHTFRVSTVLTDQKRNLSGNSTKAHAVRSSPKRLAGLSKATNNENKRNSPYRVKKSPRTMKRPIPIAKGLPFRNGINALQKKESAVQKFWK